MMTYFEKEFLFLEVTFNTKYEIEKTKAEKKKVISIFLALGFPSLSKNASKFKNSCTLHIVFEMNVPF